MARPRKMGIEYFPFDVDFFSDKKIRILKSRFGADGITIYIYLLCEVYRNGYYVQMDEDYEYIISDDLGMSNEKVKQVLKFLLERSLLDSTLFQSDTIITSHGIQKRFQGAVKGRASKSDIKVDKKYWILSDQETQPFIKYTHNTDNSENNDSYSENNPDNSENNDTKKSKVKESKEKEIPCANRFEDFWSAYPNKKRRHLAEKAYCDLIISGTISEDDLILAAQNYAEHAKESGDRMFLPNNFLEKCVFEDYLQAKEAEIPKAVKVPPESEEEPEPDPEQLAAEGWIDYGSMSDEEFEEYLKRVTGNDV